MTAKEIAEKINELFQIAEKEGIRIVLDCDAEMGGKMPKVDVFSNWRGEDTIGIW